MSPSPTRADWSRLKRLSKSYARRVARNDYELQEISTYCERKGLQVWVDTYGLPKQWNAVAQAVWQEALDSKDFFRGKKAVTRIPNQIDDSQPEPVGSEENILTKQIYEAAFASVGEEDRPLLEMILDEVPYEDMAIILDVPIGTVSSRVARAKERWKRKCHWLLEH